jgi:hypothetical protein
VHDKGALRADRSTALKILMQGLSYAAVVTALIYLLPA